MPSSSSSRRPSASSAAQITADDHLPAAAPLPPPINGAGGGGGGTGASPAHSSTSNESFYSLAPEFALTGGGGAGVLGRPWNRVDVTLQKDFAREKKAGKLTFERKVELYGEKLEEKFKELEERLLTREEELLLKGRELQRTSSPPSPFPPAPVSYRWLHGCAGRQTGDRWLIHVTLRLESRKLSFDMSSRIHLLTL